jgi:chromatin segregation and condensation protein Rec8/ScpA/Scc1 (kleisin family)
MNMTSNQNKKTRQKKLTRAILTIAALAAMAALRAHRFEEAQKPKPTRQELIDRIRYHLLEHQANESLRQVLEDEETYGQKIYTRNPYCSIWNSGICAKSPEEEEIMMSVDTDLFFDRERRLKVCFSPETTRLCWE